MINKQFEDSEKFFASLTKERVDCIVMPGFAVPPVKHGHSRSLAYACLYTFLFNVLDMPSAAIPVTLVQTGEDRYDDPEREADLTVKFAKLTSADSVGCPIGIQIGCLPYQDEQLIGIAKQFQRILPFDHIPLAKVNPLK